MRGVGSSPPGDPKPASTQLRKLLPPRFVGRLAAAPRPAALAPAADSVSQTLKGPNRNNALSAGLLTDAKRGPCSRGGHKLESLSFFSLNLIRQPNRELNDARSGSGADLTELTTSPSRIRRPDLRVIENVEDPRPESHAKPLPDDLRRLGDREVEIDATWCTEEVPRQCPIGAKRRVQQGRSPV